ncbi:MAG: DUF302 domain-containing protein [Betaproteobacteria bacterium]|nr:DUF302 domain-containing protein [Betaproteobacteria bacterium]
MFRQCLTVLVLAGTLYVPPVCADRSTVVSVVAGRYEDVRENLVFAIEGRGLVVNNISHVGDMLARTAKDIDSGKSKRIYGQSEVFEFCSAAASRAMMEADPRNIVYCPYTIAVYTLPEQTGKVFLAYRMLPSGPGLEAANKLLRGIVADAQR